MGDVPVKAVKKALQILEILLFEDPAREGVELSKLARQMSMPANSAHNLLKSMTACGFVEQNRFSRYIPGRKIRLMTSLNRIHSPRESVLLMDFLKGLSKKINESVVFTVFAGGRRLVMARCDSEQLVSIDCNVVLDQSIYNLPTGRILAAYADDRELAEMIVHNGPPLQAWQGIHTESEFKEACALIRRDEFCTIAAAGDEIAGFAAPVFVDGRLFGALGCYAPSYRCSHSRRKQIRIALTAAAKQIAQNLASGNEHAIQECVEQ